jgi:hypothetical protein
VERALAAGDSSPWRGSARRCRARP